MECQEEMVGTRVVVMNLKSRPDLNGMRGVVVQKRQNGRWAVLLDGVTPPPPISLAAKNIVPAMTYDAPVGPPLADCVESLRHFNGEQQGRRDAGEFDHDPSEQGPAKACLHGGPPPSAPETYCFIAALHACLQGKFEIIDQLRASGHDVTFHHEIDFFYRFWSQPDKASTITAKTYKVAFSCAADAAIDSEFDVARSFIRIGCFVREWAQHGGAQMLADSCSRLSGGVLARLSETMEAMHKTKTDRGLVLYLSKQLPCRCLQVSAR